MRRSVFGFALAALLIATPALSQSTSDPYPEPIGTGTEALVVGVTEFVAIPDVDGETARMMELIHEPGTDRLFVNGQRGPIWVVSTDGSAVREYLDVDDPEWNVQVEASGRERGVQNFAFHPRFAEEGAPGYGKLYTWTDTRNTDPAPDFPTEGDRLSHHTVLHEWTARTPEADRYDGGPPREMARFEQPFGNHNGGEIEFNPLATPGDPDFGLLYVGVGDGGAGGDPFDMARDASSGFGKILRIEPLGSGGTSGEYGIPVGNPYAGDDDPDTLEEIFALGLRNPQNFAWDPATGAMFVADIGQNTVEEVSVATAGADLGWNDWEGSFRFDPEGGVHTDDPRSDPALTYPVAEYDQQDPLFGGRAAVTGLHVARGDRISGLTDRVLFGDLPSGEIFAFDADDLTEGGQDGLRRVLLRPSAGNGEPRTFLELVREKNAEQGRSPASRTDLRFGTAADGRIFLLNKHDGVLRVVVPGSD